MAAKPAASALVTGASTGIGLAIATTLAADGYAVTLTARNGDRLVRAAAELHAAGHDVATHTGDASQAHAIEVAVKAHVEHWGGLDVAIANAGMGTGGTAARSTPESIDEMVGANLQSVVALARATVPHLRREDGRSGWFVVVSSLAGIWPMAGFAGYSATKAAAISIARSIAAEEAAAGVRACAICPAFVDTDLSEWAKPRLDGAPMLQANDVAEAVRFLLRVSPAASITEIVLRRAGTDPFDP